MTAWMKRQRRRHRPHRGAEAPPPSRVDRHRARARRAGAAVFRRHHRQARPRRAAPAAVDTSMRQSMRIRSTAIDLDRSPSRSASRDCVIAAACGVFVAADGRRRPMRRCRSTAGSAAPPASAAPRRSPRRRRRRVSDRARSRCASMPMSAPACHGGSSRSEVDRRAARRGRDRLLHRHQPVGARNRPAQAAYNVDADHGRRLFRQDQLLLLHRAAPRARRDARDAGRLLRRSASSSKDSDQDDLNTITLSYTFYPAASSAIDGRRRASCRPGSWAGRQEA